MFVGWSWVEVCFALKEALMLLRCDARCELVIIEEFEFKVGMPSHGANHSLKPLLLRCSMAGPVSLIGSFYPGSCIESTCEWSKTSATFYGIL